MSDCKANEHTTIKRLISCPYYTVELQNVVGRQLLKKSAYFDVMSVINGKGSVNAYPVKKEIILFLQRSEVSMN